MENSQSIKFLFYLAVWKRPEITKICFEGLRRLRKYYPDSHVHVVLSEDYYKDECDKYGFTWTECENLPVGNKKNQGLKDAFAYEWDYMIELGSDDLISNEVIDIYLRIIEKGYKNFGLNKLGIVDSKTGKCILYSYGLMGNGRCVERNALMEAAESYWCKAKETFIGNNRTGMAKGEKRWIPKRRIHSYHEVLDDSPDFRLWSPELSRALDGSSNYQLEMCGYKHEQVHTNRVLLLDIKSDENIGKFENFRGKEISLDEAFENFEEKGTFLELHERQIHNHKEEYRITG